MRKLLFGLIIVLAGCCTPRNSTTMVSIDSYVSALSQVQTNVAAIRSDILLLNYDPRLKLAHVQLLNATSALCEDALTGKNVGGGAQ